MVRHKWFVFVEACRLGVPWLGFLHDWSKLLPDEFVPYARFFYGNWPKAPEIWRRCPSYTGPTEGSVARDFDMAWLIHQHRNKHHWQYWLLVQDSDDDKILPMPDKCRCEMLADWRGAGRAITGKDNTKAWYNANQSKMQLHPTTRKWAESQL